MTCCIAFSHGKDGEVTCPECDWAPPPPGPPKSRVIADGGVCPHCGEKLKKFAWHERCYHCGKDFGPATPEPLPPAPPPGTRIFKVITQRDRFFASSFNPEVLQDVLNQHGRRGWRVISMTATDVGSFFGSFWGKGGGATRQELVILLEKTMT